MASTEQRIDALYDLPPGEFVAARDALAKELGDKSVRKLAKPTVAAAAVNRLIRARPAEAKALDRAARKLAKAQVALLEGKRVDLRAATAAARQAVDALLAHSDGDEETVRATLHAATVDEGALEAVLGARLTKPLSASGFGGFDGVLATAPKPARSRAGRHDPKPERKRTASAAQERKARAAEAKRAADAKRRRAAVRKAKAAEEALAEEVRVAEAALEDARARHEAAAAARRLAERDV